MNKYTSTSLIAVFMLFLALPIIVVAETGSGERAQKFMQEKERKIGERTEKVEARLVEQKKKVEERQQARQEKVADLKERAEKRIAEEKKNFCSNIVERMGERQEDFAERQSQFTEKKTEQVAARKEEREENDTELAEKRALALDRRERMYQNLMNKAETDEEKAAVTQFQNAVEKAVADRQAAIDAAKGAFRNGVDAARASRQADGSQALAAFKNDMQQALSQAKADCEAGKEQSEVRQAYQEALVSARTELKETRAKNGLGETVSQLAKTRTEAVKKALTDYRSALETAFAALKEVLGDTETMETPSPEL